MRDLASIVTVEKVWPLEGKDKVQGCSFVENGYEAMVGKEIQPGDLVAFIQEGSILPVKDEWEWLRKRCFKDSVNGFVIKPMKFASIKSWGLVVALKDVEELKDKNVKAGDDITDILGIRKYEPEEDASPKKGESKKAYPKFIKFCLSHILTRWIGRIWQKKHQNTAGGFPTDLISKSDETTIQNMKAALERYAESEVVVTAKMEGQSCVSSDTIIDTENGQKTIKELVDSNFSGKVWSVNDSGEKELKTVEKCHCLENDDNTQWFELETEDGRKLKITGNDMVYLPEFKCYRRVDELVGNEKLLINE